MKPPLPSRGDAPVAVSSLMGGGLRHAPVTAALLAANLVVFAAMLFKGAGLWHSPNGVQLAWGANFGPATRDGEWWRLGTAMFLHFGLVHLAVNLWALWDAGRLVERLYGHLRFLAVYLAAGVTGNLLSLLVHGDHAVSGGASGAIFGAYGALLVCLWRERRQVHPVDFRWLFGGGAAFAAVMLALGLLVPGIDNAAHLGGLVCGALAGHALARPLSPASPAPGRSRWAAAAALLGAVAMLIASLPAPQYRWRDEQQARSEIRGVLDNERRIAARWRDIVERSRRPGASFEELATRIESDIATEYDDSFEQLSALDLDPAAPSAGTVEALKRYSKSRSEASHALAEALMQNDPARIRDALEALRKAPYPNGSAPSP